MATKYLQQQFLNFWFVLNELPASEDSEGGSTIFGTAYKTVETGIGKLPVAIQAVNDGGIQYEVPAYDLCAAEGAEELEGKLAWVVSLHSENCFETPTAAAVKAFLVCCFAEAARMHGGTARLAKVTLQSHTMVVEEETLPMEAL